MIFSGEYILIFCGEYHIISNASIVNNCIICDGSFCSTTVIPTNGNFGTSYTAHVRLDLTRCHGHERDLGQCEHLPWDKLTTCSDYSPYTIGVMCVPESSK